MSPPQRALLIASGAYLDSELQLEFGKLPPAFLPLENKRLYQHQLLELSSSFDKIHLSLPEDYVLDELDKHFLELYKVEITFVPEGLSLGNSLVYVINVNALSSSELSIIHGDTLLQDIDLLSKDAVSVNLNVPRHYDWGAVFVENNIIDFHNKTDRNCNAILTGFFTFTSPAKLVQAITKSNGSFLEGLRYYSEYLPLEAITSNKWFDFGHGITYHRSRQSFTTEREFNKLKINSRLVTKSGCKPEKIIAESEWYLNIPSELRIFTPIYLGKEANEQAVSYTLEYLYLPTLSDIFVFGKLNINAWEGIFDACEEVLSSYMRHPGELTLDVIDEIDDLYRYKTFERLEMFARKSGFNIDCDLKFKGKSYPSLVNIADSVLAKVPKIKQKQYTVTHGDLCFSNMLFDVRSNILKLIDPRGLNSRNVQTIYGDIRYDLSKLNHSLIGLYDFIISKRCKVQFDMNGSFDISFPIDERIKNIQAMYAERNFLGGNHDGNGLHEMTILLFLSMLPFHADNAERQFSFVANALRLFEMADK